MNRQIILVVVALISISHTCFAHRIIVFAWVEDNQILVESSFGADRPAKQCDITVMDQRQHVVHKGRTNDMGKYAFALPHNVHSDLNVVLNAGEGHQAVWTIPFEEISQKGGPADMKQVKDQKEKLQSKPSALKIIVGIALIFGLAGLVKWFKRKKTR